MDTKRVRFAVDGLDYDWNQFTILHFVDHIAHLRQRPINMLPLQLQDFSGMCLSTPKQDYIAFDNQRHPNLQIHTKLHELAHLILGHTISIDIDLSGEQILSILLHVNTRTIHRYSDPIKIRQENEAEYFAFVVEGYVASHKRLHQLTLTDHADDIYMPPFTGDAFTGD